jgi:hypothetical protein
MEETITFHKKVFDELRAANDLLCKIVSDHGGMLDALLGAPND